MKTAILLCNMGGPDSLDAVRPYLQNIFLDPDIISLPLPGMLRRWFAQFLAAKREPKSRKIFQSLGGKSPLLEITQRQANSLESMLQAHLPACRVFPAMRYWHPFIEEAWENAVNQGFETIVALSMYPFYSRATTGSIVRLVKELSDSYGSKTKNVVIIDRFGAHPLFIQGMAEQIMAATDPHSATVAHVLLSAHSVPLSLIQKGDPYAAEIDQTVAALRQTLPDSIQLHLSFQSKIGPVTWLGPSTDEKIKALAAITDKLWVYPLGFVADNSETIYEIGQLYKELAHQVGITHYVCLEALNDHPTFMRALVDLIKKLAIGN